MTLTRSGAEIAEYFDLLRGSACGAGPAIAARDVPGRDASGGAAATADVLAELKPRYNIAPSQPVLTLHADADGRRRAAWRRWGLVPSWAPDPGIGSKLFNARSETVAEKPSFRGAFRARRCLVVADGFYEWSRRGRGRRPHHFRPRDAPLLALAGLHERWVGEDGTTVDSCTVLTTEASADVAPVHERMPVLLVPEAVADWLDPTMETERLAGWLRPAEPGRLEARPVSHRVDDPRRDDPECLAPASDPPPGPLFA